MTTAASQTAFAILFFLLVLALPAFAQDSFAEWKANFLTLARKSGISEQTIKSSESLMVEDPKVVEIDGRQPEKTQTYAEYIGKVITDRRVRRARAAYRAYGELLNKIEAEFSVPAEVVVAIWTLESEQGDRQGNFKTITSLSTLAYEGRRREMFESELMAALKVVEDYQIKPAELQGSWAGAMGQTQFMPSSLLKYGVNYDGLGRVDIWNSVPDSLASIANYLQENGWDKSVGISQNVRIPEDLDLAAAKEKLAKPVSEWHTLGVARPTGAALYLSGAPATLVLPDGEGGQAFLAYDNFGVLLRWNRSTYFALSVADLAGRINPKLKNVKP